MGSRSQKEALKIEYNDESHTIAEWSKITGISKDTLRKRYVYNKWSLDMVFSEEKHSRIKTLSGENSRICQICKQTRTLDNFSHNPGCYLGRDYICKYCKTNDTKMRARRILRDAVRRDKIVKGTCVVCGDKNTHGHHTDYNKPLEVQWLCAKHHSEVHKH